MISCSCNSSCNAFAQCLVMATFLAMASRVPSARFRTPTRWAWANSEQPTCEGSAQRSAVSLVSTCHTVTSSLRRTAGPRSFPTGSAFRRRAPAWYNTM